MDKLFAKNKTKQMGLFGKTAKEAANAEQDEEMQVTEAGPSYVPWVEKYRPSKIDEVSH